MTAPFPWFGGKRRVAGLVWERFGDVPNYVEPFAGSLAVLLDRPHEPRCETVNDKDCYISNFWRAMAADPEELAYHADWPVNEADLHARHSWLSNQEWFQEAMKTDPNYFDVRIAGWWVWGLSMWIGGGWCGESSRRKCVRQMPSLTKRGENLYAGKAQKTPKLRRGGNFAEHWRKRPNLKRGAVGVQRRRPHLKHGHGVHRTLPDISGAAGAYGKGIHASGLDERMGGLVEYFTQLQARLRRVRVCCGKWERILGYSPTTAIGMTGVFLDPPYSAEADRDNDIYREEDAMLAHDVREWAIANGENPMMRIALCGYDGEHLMPESWSVKAWQSNGGYANQSEAATKGKKNRERERIWFSPHCLGARQPELL